LRLALGEAPAVRTNKLRATAPNSRIRANSNGLVNGATKHPILLSLRWRARLAAPRGPYAPQALRMGGSVLKEEVAGWPSTDLIISTMERSTELPSPSHFAIAAYHHFLRSNCLDVVLS
jgi:hypothetical protein